jgi:hypothetical protein
MTAFAPVATRIDAVDDGRIVVEHCDVIQQVPDQSSNDSTMVSRPPFRARWLNLLGPARVVSSSPHGDPEAGEPNRSRARTRGATIGSVSRRTAGVLASIYYLGIYAFLCVVAGPALGSVIAAVAFGFVGILVGSLVWATHAAGRRRVRALAPEHAGWTFLPVLTTRSQIDSMRATGRRAVVGVAATLGWGPGGLGMWTTRHGRPAQVFSYAWVDVAEVAETDTLRTIRDRRAPGIRIRLVGGSAQNVQATADKTLRAAHPGATPAGAVALAIMDARSVAMRG